MALKMFNGIKGAEKVLDYHLQRHNLLASNLANAETPNFRPRELLFDERMKKEVALAGTNGKHYGVSKALSQREDSTNFVEKRMGPVSPDKNGVHIEKAMGRLSANKIRYNASVEVIRRRMAMLRYAATDGGR